jgi:hypothetical protein
MVLVIHLVLLNIVVVITHGIILTDHDSQQQHQPYQHQPYQHQPLRVPGYWPKYSGSRRVFLLDGIWNASILAVKEDDEEQEKTTNSNDNDSSNIASRSNTRRRFDSMDPNIDISKIITKEQVLIPSTIEVIHDPEHGSLPGYRGYRGVSFFRTQFETTTTTTGGGGNGGGGNGEGSARIQFQACSFYCRVWLNGIEIGDHTAGGYVSWWLDVPSTVLKQGRRQQQQRQQRQQRQTKKKKKKKKKKYTTATTATPTTTNRTVSQYIVPISTAAVVQHELFVLVDNRFNYTTAPLHTGGDFWQYGGILRSVEWHECERKRSRPISSSSSVVNVFGSDFDDDNDNDNDNDNDDESSFSNDDDHDFDSNNHIVEEEEHRTTTIASEIFTNRKNNNLLSSLWPWRLYIFPQKDLRTVKLTLQLWVGEEKEEDSSSNNDNNNSSTNNTNTYHLPDDDDQLLKELIQNNQISLYFDGNTSSNVLLLFDDDDYLIAPTVGMRTLRNTDTTTTTTQQQQHEHEQTQTQTQTQTQQRLVDLGVFYVPEPRVWSTTNPQLHNISVNLNGAIVTERFGLRYWDVGNYHSNSTTITNNNNNSSSSSSSSSSRIRLNGKVLKLVGWNHHTQFPYTGASPTDEQLDDDIRILKELGYSNFVRGAHYPQNPKWLDLLDEHGIVMWSETLGPGVSLQNLQDDYFLEQQEQQINEMVDNALNHASIAFWGFFNEGPSHKDEACNGYQASSDAILFRDTTRFITYASNIFPPHDRCYRAATVISHNGYPGWYATENPETFWNRIANDLQSGSIPSAIGKPFIISEAGAGGIYEWKQNDTATMWTLEYQSKVISENVDVAVSNSNISGIVLWHITDFKVDDKWENNTHCDYLPGIKPLTCGYIKVDTSKAFGRPGGANHKGSLDFFRRPKPIFSIVASRYKNITYTMPTTTP